MYRNSLSEFSNVAQLFSAVDSIPVNAKSTHLSHHLAATSTATKRSLQFYNVFLLSLLFPNCRKPPKIFAFDHCFYSTDPDAENFASQELVFANMGRDILDNAFQGYNACIFAYGQTGSGKSYTMMGNQENKGIIPRLCDELFGSIAAKQTEELTYKVEVSYMEIYNEKVHDLLDPKTSKQSLKVREHNVLGPYVDGLSQLAVTSFMVGSIL